MGGRERWPGSTRKSRGRGPEPGRLPGRTRTPITGDKRRFRRSICVDSRMPPGGHLGRVGGRVMGEPSRTAGPCCEGGPSGATALLAGAIAYALGACAQVAPGEMTRPTPCPDWDLAALLAHLAASMSDLESAIRTGHLDPEPGQPRPRQRRPGGGAARPGREPAVRVLRPPRPRPVRPRGRPAAARRSSWPAPEPWRSPCTAGTSRRPVATAARSRPGSRPGCSPVPAAGRVPRRSVRSSCGGVTAGQPR